MANIVRSGWQYTPVTPSHQAQLEKVEEIYKNNLDEMADIVDGDVEASVRNVRENADQALERLRSESSQSDNKGIYRQTIF